MWPVRQYAPGQLTAALMKPLLCTRLQGEGWGTMSPGNL